MFANSGISSIFLVRNASGTLGPQTEMVSGTAISFVGL